MYVLYEAQVTSLVCGRKNRHSQSSAALQISRSCRPPKAVHRQPHSPRWIRAPIHELGALGRNKELAHEFNRSCAGNAGISCDKAHHPGIFQLPYTFSSAVLLMRAAYLPIRCSRRPYLLCRGFPLLWRFFWRCIRERDAKTQSNSRSLVLMSADTRPRFLAQCYITLSAVSFPVSSLKTPCI